MDGKDRTLREIYLAGGCFWGMEHLMQSLRGVVDAQSGYANGNSAEQAVYKTICAGGTGFRETVKVTYDPDKTSLDAILFAYFAVIDPTVQNRQGNDVGEQYQTGIYYTNAETKETAERIAALEKQRADAFYVEIGPLQNFYPAEDYHQDYLVHNPNGYCHIPFGEMQRLRDLRIDAGNYPLPDRETLRRRLTPAEYAVTQESGTEPPFENPFWNDFRRGIYVDAATGEPLFSSADKFESSCGWPAFSKPIEEPCVVKREDCSYGMRRTEVRSRAGNSHLGHVFYGEPQTPAGVRYCINSAALRFIPAEEMEKAGYGYLLGLFEPLAK